MKTLLGIDYGTGGCKVTVLDETGKFVGEASTEFTTYHDHPGWSEQEPGDWWDALCASLKKLAEKGVDLAQIGAIALDGSTHNAVLLGRVEKVGGESRSTKDDSSSRGCNSANCTGGFSSSGGCNSANCTLRPVRRTIMWTDQRATAECECLRTARRPDGTVWADYLFDRCYQMPAPTWTLPQLMWLKHHEPEVLEKTEQVLFVKDYVRYLLTGVACTDYIEAQGTLLFDMSSVGAFHGNAPTGETEKVGGESRSTKDGLSSRGCNSANCTGDTFAGSGCNSANCTCGWNEELVELSGLKLSAMPEIVRPTDVVGAVTPEAAAATGLPVGCKVVCGTSDSAVEDYGAGAVEPGDLIIKLATAGNVNAMTANAHPHPKTLTYSHVVPGMWYSVSATNAAALCMRWMRDTFYVGGGVGERCRCTKDGSNSTVHLQPTPTPNLYSIMDAEAAASPVGANGVMFHPYLQGERCPYWDPNLRASFTGVSISSVRGDFVRALMEGVAFSLRDCYRTLEEMQLPVKRIFLIGGGARSKLWSEIVANVFNVAVAVPTPADASFGSCLLAGVGLGIWPDAKAAVAKCLKIDRTIEPDPQAAATYARLFQRYRAIHDALSLVV